MDKYTQMMVAIATVMLQNYDRVERVTIAEQVMTELLSCEPKVWHNQTAVSLYTMIAEYADFAYGRTQTKPDWLDEEWHIEIGNNRDW